MMVNERTPWGHVSETRSHLPKFCSVTLVYHCIVGTYYTIIYNLGIYRLGYQLILDIYPHGT